MGPLKYSWEEMQEIKSFCCCRISAKNLGDEVTRAEEEEVAHAWPSSSKVCLLFSSFQRKMIRKFKSNQLALAQPL